MANAVIRATLFLLAFAMATWSPAHAQSGLRLAEQDIKAGLLYSFLRYTDWPNPNQAAPVRVCMFGRDSFDGRLQPLAGRTVNQRAIEVTIVRAPAETDACALLFVSTADEARWPELRAHLAGHDVMTVGDFGGFAASGGMIEFVRAENRIGVNINVEAVRSGRLAVQDRLLRLGSAVRTAATRP
ncbi:MAG: YfiR family protein [Terricaulis sp.]